MGRRWSNDARISQSQGVLRPIFAVVSPFIDRRDTPGLRAWMACAPFLLSIYSICAFTIGTANDGKRVREVVLINEMAISYALEQQTVLALNKLGRSVTSSLELDDVLVRVTSEVTDLLQAEGVAIILPDGEDALKFVAASGEGAIHLLGVVMPAGVGVAGYVMETGEAFWINAQGSSSPGLDIYRQIETISRFHTQSLLAAPLIQEDQVIGVLEAVHSDPDKLTEEDLATLVMAANWATIAISNAQLHQQTQQLREQQAALEERTRLAHELHDVVTQSLYSMSVLSGAWRRQIESGRLEPQKEHIVELDHLARQALREVRLLVYELRPAELEEEGLIGALSHRLEAVEQRTGIKPCLMVMDEKGRPHPMLSGGRAAVVDFYHFRPETEFSLYRITQEALNNILKHSEATSVNINIRLGAETLSMEIIDDGRGFDVNSIEATAGFGLASLRERAKQIGGSLQVKSAPGKGTTIMVRDVPYRLVDDEEVKR